ncbi:uncharacterized protein PV06_10905 [Exophiala oligosperma]|uniref:Zn(2)-C6 fungal-type domain-containing protein n=1 Tax=Exophiala oligosperma TaxID=215243 RepID=A0A0D2BHZ2_9EURO|nr:uncharacterized protein PV06_10905 [Exophiala oligosperma]KIW37007.1 hypothetical protein PV06_10905 [Exophiala oligosperma]
METNHRRSRTGCMNCRAIRTKCDELKPKCRRCMNRGVVCKGYVRKLRWVGEALPTIAATRKQRSDLVVQKQQAEIKTGYVSTRLQNLKLLSTVTPLDALDRALVEHWMMMTLQLVSLDPAATYYLGQMYDDLTSKDESLTLRAMLSNSAAHLLTLGRVPESTFVLLQQQAFTAMRCSLKKLVAESSMLFSNRMPIHSLHMPFSSLDDDAIVGSLLLIDDEIIRPDNCYSAVRVQFLLQGTYSLVAERHKYFECPCPRPHPARSEPHYKLDSPLFQSSVSFLAWADIMSCVPCARPPILDKRYWLEGAIKTSRENARKLQPNNDLGYCAQVLSLLGDCTTAVHSLYTQIISEEEFTQMGSYLHQQLDQAMADLPEPKEASIDTPIQGLIGVSKATMVEGHNACIAAAICHGLATQIFLLRATDHERESPQVTTLCDRLFSSLRQLSANHSVVTISLWPLWVLGCESHGGVDNSTKEFVVMFLEAVFKRQCMKNVERCLITLREEVWTLDPSSTDQVCEKPPVPQSAWVWHCYNQGIRLLLA